MSLTENRAAAGGSRRTPEALTVPAPRGTCPFTPPPAYERARRHDPVARVTLWNDSPAWVVTRHDHIREVLGDARFSADARRPGFPFLNEGREVLNSGAPTFMRMDDPEHARLRRMLTADFMVKRIDALRPRIQQVTDDLIDRLTARRSAADLVADFALPLPTRVICMLLGVPYEDHDFFQRNSKIALSNTSSANEVDEARHILVAYLVDLARSKGADPDDGVISRLAGRGDVPAEQVAFTSLLLLVAGHETTANMVAMSVLALLRDPAQATRLRERPASIAPAVEELLRYLSVVHAGLPRVATEDVEIGGRTIPAGEGVLLMLNAGNHDDDAFPGADQLDLERDARHHVAFGFGVHQCVGQSLARAELQIALGTILRRLPGLRLGIPFEELDFRDEMLVYGVSTLPVVW
jgi:cytochrome P450